MQLSSFGKASHSQQNLPQEKQTLSRSVNNAHGIKPNKFLTEISVAEALHCSIIDVTMHWMDGSKNEATSELRKNKYSDSIMLEAYPRSFNWPERMLRLGSLSRMVPNLIYCGSSAFLNLSLVVLSKHLTMWGISPEKRDCPSNPNNHD